MSAIAFALFIGFLVLMLVLSSLGPDEQDRREEDDE